MCINSKESKITKYTKHREKINTECLLSNENTTNNIDKI